MLKDLDPVCSHCNTLAKDIPDYQIAAEREGMSVNEFVEIMEGTFNATNAHFLCDNCYNLLGMPLGIAP